MSLALTANEIVDALERAGHPDAQKFQDRLVALANEAAEALADKLGVACGEGCFDLGDVQVVFMPQFNGQECPEILAQFDDPDEWGEDMGVAMKP